MNNQEKTSEEIAQEILSSRVCFCVGKGICVNCAIKIRAIEAINAERKELRDKEAQLEADNEVIFQQNLEIQSLEDKVKKLEEEVTHQKNLKESFEDQSWKLADEVKRLREAIQECLSSGKIEYWWAETLQKALSTVPEVPKKEG